ncbi:redoxin family protein [Crocinitomicaceae bacterium]|nr:redoxin family protein [Crocinitomicaceae bacterium]MDC0257572.1 redoxin family protein [Crocinitomicaceae bacterium]
MKTKSKMNRVKGVGALLLAGAFAFGLSSVQSSKPGDDELKIGKKMPLGAYEMIGSDDATYTLNELKKENGLIVVFSCNTCPFVVGSDNFDGWEGQYNSIYKKAKANKIGMVLVNSNVAKREGDDSKSAMADHKSDLGYTMPYVIDKDAKLADALGAKTTPHVYMFDGRGKLVFKGSIDNSWDTKRENLETYLFDAIAAVGSGDEIPITSSTPRGCSIKRAK